MNENKMNKIMVYAIMIFFVMFSFNLLIQATSAEATPETDGMAKAYPHALMNKIN